MNFITLQREIISFSVHYIFGGGSGVYDQKYLTIASKVKY